MHSSAVKFDYQLHGIVPKIPQDYFSILLCHSDQFEMRYLTNLNDARGGAIMVLGLKVFLLKIPDV
jgi:hypothetical protein